MLLERKAPVLVARCESKLEKDNPSSNTCEINLNQIGCGRAVFKKLKRQISRRKQNKDKSMTSPYTPLVEAPPNEELKIDCDGIKLQNRLEDLLSKSPNFQCPKMTPVSRGDSPTVQVDEATIPRRLMHSSSSDIHEMISLDVNNESKVLVLYTGGTIGMVRNDEGVLACLPYAMENMIRSTITLHDEKYSSIRFKKTLDRNDVAKDCLLPLVLPNVPDHKRVIYTIYEYDPLLDSSNMTMDDWITIANDIKKSYNIFDGFVVLHGTDTLGYTASALSFMLEDLGKPVILTGSQIPCFETRSDGRDNFVGALILAGNYSIPEVCVYFRHTLMRGNRTVKVSSGDLDAFHSPNMTPLVKAGIDFEVDYRAIHRPKTISKFKVHNTLSRNVVLLRLFPSITTETVAHFLAPPIEGVVLQCYGAGNIPSNRKDIIKLFKDAADRGVLIISVTQCVSGGVSGLYETGKALLDVGVMPGADITPEAALTKLSYVLSKDNWDFQKRREAMVTNLVGEITVLRIRDVKKSMRAKEEEDQGQLELIQAVADSLHLDTSEELKEVSDMLFPALLCSAIYKADMETVTALKKHGADIAVPDYDKRTPLHVAASEGNLEMVKYLLQNGAPVHVRDRLNESPLRSAINAGHMEVVECLVQCGAHLQVVREDLGELLCQAARLGEIGKLRCFRLAGASLGTRNTSQQTPLHSAVETGNFETVEFLLNHGVKTNSKNCYGMTPIDIAEMLPRQQILEILKIRASNAP